MTLAEEYKNQAKWRNWDYFVNKLPVQSQDTIIDIGCSVGTMTGKLALRSKQVIGIDSNPELLAEANKGATASNISSRLMDARFLNDSDFPRADGIWSSFLPAYIPDFSPVLSNWLRLLKPDGWIALVEMSDLFGHHPLSYQTKELFKDYCDRYQRLYDVEMGSKLGDIAADCGLSIISNEIVPDQELSFKGPASTEILAAWDSRLNRMTRFQQFVGDSRFTDIKKEFLECLSDINHTSDTTVNFVIARKDFPDYD